MDMYTIKNFTANQAAIASRLTPTIRTGCIREILIGCEAAIASKLCSYNMD
jgi:hypothetical protein